MVQGTKKGANMIRKICIAIIFLFAVSSFVTGADVKISPAKGLVVNGKNFFPLMVCLMPEMYMDQCASLGINTFACQDDRAGAEAYMEKVKKRGIHLLRTSDVAKIHRGSP